MGPYRASQSKVVEVWICPGLPFIFLAFQYIMGINWTSQSLVVVIWICQELPCLILSFWIYYKGQLGILVKNYGRLNLPRASLFDFECFDILWASIGNPNQKFWQFEFALGFLFKYLGLWDIMALTRAFQSKVAVWICPWLSCSILSVAIYDGPQSSIKVKSYGRFNLLKASFFYF